jgi:hypothetical protein
MVDAEIDEVRHCIMRLSAEKTTEAGKLNLHVNMGRIFVSFNFCRPDGILQPIAKAATGRVAAAASAIGRLQRRP